MVALSELAFDERGLLPAVVQDADSGTLLMVAYVNRESLEKTIETGEVHFWSRSRGRLWKKGESSGNVLRVRGLTVDCDRDCLLVRAEPAGPACHTGERSCFFTPLEDHESGEPHFGDVLGRLSRTIRERDEHRPEGSYTTSLFDEGVERVAQKVGEEAVEAVIAGATHQREGLIEESADLLYHLLVLWRASGVDPKDVARALEARAGKTKTHS